MKLLLPEQYADEEFDVERARLLKQKLLVMLESAIEEAICRRDQVYAKIAIPTTGGTREFDFEVSTAEFAEGPNHRLPCKQMTQLIVIG